MDFEKRLQKASPSPTRSPKQRRSPQSPRSPTSSPARSVNFKRTESSPSPRQPLGQDLNETVETLEIKPDQNDSKVESKSVPKITSF